MSDFTKLGLPESWDVGYAYSPRENTGSSGGYHLIVGEDFAQGRLKRDKGDPLCGKRFYNLGPGRKGHAVTCRRCLELARKYFPKE